MSEYLRLAYLKGAMTARQKLATAAGPIAYAPRSSQSHLDNRADERDDLWAEFDQEDKMTGEESALGMPSAGGIAKTADSGDTGYGYQGHGSYAQGGFDANQPRPDRYKRMSSAMQEAFEANENYDKSYADEPAITQPHGSKYAGAIAALSAALKSDKKKKKPPNKPLELKGTKLAISLGGGSLGSSLGTGLPSSSTQMMSPTQAPKPKPINATDPRADKPPGMNLQHGVQTSVSAADSEANFASPMRRQQGMSV